MIHAERCLEALREPHVSIEEAELLRGPRPAGTGGRLVGRIKGRDPGTVTAEEQLLKPVVRIGAPDPRVRRATAEQAHAAAQERAGCAPDIVADPEARRPEQRAARQARVIDAQPGPE